MEHRIHAKISPKAASEKAQTTVSKNRYTNPIIDVFRTVVLSLLASTRNSVLAPFLVHQVPRTSATVWRYRRVFIQFSLRAGVSDYTCRPMIAKLLYFPKYFNRRLFTGTKSLATDVRSSDSDMMVSTTQATPPLVVQSHSGHVPRARQC